MTRGKYKSSAEAREARESAMAQAARLQREVERLSKANAALEADMSATASSHAEVIADLRRQVDDVTSSTVRTQADEIAALKADIEDRKLAWQKAEIAYQCTNDALAEAYEAAGMGTVDAREAALNRGVYALSGGFVFPVDEATVTFDTAGVRKSTSGKVLTEKEKAVVRAVQKAKGLRK